MISEIFISVNGAFVRIGDCHDIRISHDCINEQFGLFVSEIETLMQTTELSAKSSAELIKLFRQIDSRRLLRRKAIAKARGKNWRHVR